MKKRTYALNPAGCPVEATMDAIGGKYKGMILYHLLEGPKRHTELRKLCAGVTQRMVTLQLRELQKAGLVKREVFAVVPQQVDYSLTGLGLSLGPILRLTQEWGVRYMGYLDDDRDDINTVVV